MSSVRVAIAQINACVGDLNGNAMRVLDAARRAAEGGANVLLTPELVLTGYPPEDLLLRPSFIAQAQATLEKLISELSAFPGLHVVLGHVSHESGRLHNSASVLVDGKVLGTYHKRELPNYSVFDEQRYFVPGHSPFAFDVGPVRFGINICEDAWFMPAPRAAASIGARVLLIPNASPFSLGKQQRRVSVAQQCVKDTGCALIYANLAGGQDELIFDGASFALDARGELACRTVDFLESLTLIDVDAKGNIRFVSSDQAESAPPAKPMPELLCHEAQVWGALKVGVSDYVRKNGFKTVTLGLSGGIDSAVVLAVAVDALGSDRVSVVMMPSRYTADISQIDARDMASRLGVKYDVIPIADLAHGFEKALSPLFSGTTADTTEENIQARSRGVLLMALSNKFGHLVLTTGNKSELSTGYCTLYGDMAGGFAVLKDVVKTMVYRIAEWRNRISLVIPKRIITRAPSAELRPDQTDQDNLPPYEVIDGIIERYVEQDLSAAQVVEAGFPKDAVEQIIRLIRINEYKRRQGPPGPRITERAFGRDWRYPLSNGFRDLI